MGCYSVWINKCPDYFFMRLMNEVLKYFIGNFVIVYLDDTLVFRKTEEEHLRHLTLVMRRLQQEKCVDKFKENLFHEDIIHLFGFCDLFE